MAAAQPSAYRFSTMGYAGYVPAKYASKLTPEQQALKAVGNEASYELMAKVVRNVVRPCLLRLVS